MNDPATEATTGDILHGRNKRNVPGPPPTL